MTALQLGIFDAPRSTPERPPTDPGPLVMGKIAGKSSRKIASTTASHRNARELADAYYARWGREATG